MFLFLIFIKLSVDNIDHIDGLLTPDLSPDNIPLRAETPVITIFGPPPSCLHLLTQHHRNVDALTPSSGCPPTHPGAITQVR